MLYAVISKGCIREVSKSLREAEDFVQRYVNAHVGLVPDDSMIGDEVKAEAIFVTYKRVSRPPCPICDSPEEHDERACSPRKEA